MKNHFLGKSIPKGKKPNPRRTARPSWFGLLVVPIVAAGTFVALQQKNLSVASSPRTSGAALNRVLAQSAPAPTATSSYKGAPVDNPCASHPDGGNVTWVSKAFHGRVPDSGGYTWVDAQDVTIFPIVPPWISGYDFQGNAVADYGSPNKPDANQADKVCTQAFWTAEVFYWFIFKALTFLNWLATALAIILTIYAAILYISGFASEANVKKAKGLLIGTYVGLGIVLLAKIIVGAGIEISGGDPNSLKAPVNTSINRGVQNRADTSQEAI